MFKIFYFYLSGWVFFFTLLFRGLREDQRLVMKFPTDPFSTRTDPYAFQTGRHFAVLFNFFNKYHSSGIEALSLFSVTAFLAILLLDSRELFFIAEGGFALFSFLPTSCVYACLCFLLLRQSSYAYFCWTFFCNYVLIWVLLGTVVLMGTSFAYFGLITHNIINETTAISSLGLISSLSGLEKLLVPFSTASEFSWYFGEGFHSLYRSGQDAALRFDLLQFTLTPHKMSGDMYIPPHALTPYDDHN